MVWREQLQRLVDGSAGALSLSGRSLKVRDRSRLPAAVDAMAHRAALAGEPEAGLARWLIRDAAAQVGVYRPPSTVCTGHGAVAPPATTSPSRR